MPSLTMSWEFLMNSKSRSVTMRRRAICRNHSAAALFSLSMVDENKVTIGSSNPEACNSIGQMPFIQTLVELIKEGTPKNKECATAVLLELGINNSSHVLSALQFGVYDHLVELSKNGTSRAQRKANTLLHHMSKCEQVP